jgi:predicted PurR-regulated permease PerM
MTNGVNPSRLFLLALTLVALYLCYVLFRPYAGPVVLAVVIAIVFHPLYSYFLRRFRKPNSSALVSTLTTLVITVVPLVFVGIAISGELSSLYQSLAARSAGRGGIASYFFQGIEEMISWIGRVIPIPALDVRGMVMRRVGELSGSLVQWGAGLLGNLFSFVVNTVIASLVLFFLFRDGETGLKYLASVLPLPKDRIEELQHRISSTLVANFYGGVAVGAAQGTLTALAFWVLGLGSPILWGLVTAVFSFVPVVGSAAVWVPAGVVLLFTGHVVKGIVLLAWGAGVVGLADNVIRPWIISGRTQLNTVFVLLSLLGGVQAFGILGLFIGPVILSVTAALLEMMRAEYEEAPIGDQHTSEKV